MKESFIRMNRNDAGQLPYWAPGVGGVIVLANVAAIAGTAAPALAHQVQVQADVGATLHIEPDDIPKAGAVTDIWFALTQAGGTVIPLEACDCELTIYDASGAIMATPELTPTSAEGYADIPGASTTFPDVGAYELVLTGAPAGDVEFQPFELRFETTVAGRAAPSTSAASETEPNNPIATDEPVDPLLAPSADPEPAASEPENIAADIPIAEDAPATAGETQTLEPTSFPWGAMIAVVGLLVAAGGLWGIIGRSKSSGGKS